MPDFIRRKEKNKINEEKALRMIGELESNGPMKPWTLISRVRREDEDHHKLRVNVLKPLTLKGYITPNADGDIYVDDQMSFRQDHRAE